MKCASAFPCLKIAARMSIDMATEEDYLIETERLARETEREALAIEKARDLHGGEKPNPLEAPMPQIIAQFGTWAVTPFGVECLVRAYEIQWDSLTDRYFDMDYWLRHVSRHQWVNLHDFVEAMRHGRTIHMYLQGIQPPGQNS